MNDSFYPQMINRSVVMVIPKKPFYKWEKNVFPDLGSIEGQLHEYNSYLLKDSILPSEHQKVLRNDWDWIFENELNDICTDENTWPQERDWETFTEWFDLKFSTVVMDLVDEPVLKE